MKVKVIKRDGKKQSFDSSKIKKAIKGAFEDINQSPSDDILNILVSKVLEQLTKKEYTVEQIQDIVELTLMKEGYYNIAKAFIKYRQIHKLARNRYQEMMDLVNEKMQAKNVQNQNANLDENTFSGREKHLVLL